MDISYLLFLQSIRQALGPLAEKLFDLISLIGAAGIAVGVLLYLLYDKKKGFFIMFTFAFGNMVGQFLKDLFTIYRPWVRDARVTPGPSALKSATGYSFPSGHSQAAASAYGATAWKYKAKKGLRIFLIIFILLVGFSRNYLGVHTPQDVIVGLLVGTCAVFATQAMFNWYHRKKRNDLVLMIIGIAVVLVLAVITVLKPYPMDYVDGTLLVDPIKMQDDALKSYGLFGGLLAGWAGERNYVRFTTKHLDTKTRIVRLIVTLLIAGILYFGFDKGLSQFADIRLAKFLAGFSVMLGGVFLGPLCFTKIEGRSA